VNSGNVLQTQFTYDPFGNPSTTGTASQYPYLFKGMEYDATGLYKAGSVYYSPSLGRPLQQVTPGGGGGGQGGINVSTPSQGSGGLGGFEGILANDSANLAIGGGAGVAATGIALAIFGSELATPVVGWIAAGVTAVVAGFLDLFGFDLFGGGSAPVIPPGYYRPAHYVASQFIGCSDVTPNMQDSANQEAAGPASTGIAIIGETATVAFEGFEIGSGFVAVTVGALLIAAGAEALTHYIKGERNWEKARGDDPYWSMTPADLRKIENDPRSTPAQKERAKRIRKQKEHKGSR
jgi:hypothetical protein